MRAVRYDVMEKHDYQPVVSLLLLSQDEWDELAYRSAGLKYNIERQGVRLWPT